MTAELAKELAAIRPDMKVVYSSRYTVIQKVSNIRYCRFQRPRTQIQIVTKNHTTKPTEQTFTRRLSLLLGYMSLCCRLISVRYQIQEICFSLGSFWLIWSIISYANIFAVSAIPAPMRPRI